MLVHEIINNGFDTDIAVVDEGRRTTYAELKQKISEYRNHLYALGIRTGDRVGIFSRNSAEFIFTYFATTSLGAIAVPINFQLSPRETAYILQDAGIKHLLTYEQIEFDEEIPVTQHDITTFGEKNFPDAPELPADFDENNPCVIIYTSGTTGNPKGAVLSHKILSTIPANAKFSNATVRANPFAFCRCIIVSAGRVPCSIRFIAARNSTSCASSDRKT